MASAKSSFVIGAILVLSACVDSRAYADRGIRLVGSYERTSPNGLYHVYVLPGLQDDPFAAVANLFIKDAIKEPIPQAILKGPTSADIRTYPLLNSSSPTESVLLNDGLLITFDNYMSESEVIVCYDRTGQVQWSHTLEELIPPDFLSAVPRTISMYRWWYKEPLEWQVDNQVDGTTLVLTLWNDARLKCRLSDGRVEYVSKQLVGNHPVPLAYRSPTKGALGFWK